MPPTSRITWQIEHVPRSALQISGSLREAWAQDPIGSAFAAPSFLNARIRDLASDRATPVVARGMTAQGDTVAFWPLMVDRGGVLRFLQDGFADHCTCSALPGLDDHQLGEGLAQVVHLVRPRGVFFKNVPPWGPTLQAARAGLSQCGWSYTAFPATPCPVIRVDEGPDAAQRFRQEIERHKRVKSYHNRLARFPDCRFEALRGSEEMEAWADEFCDLHEWRWNRTATPSRYRDSRARAALVAHLNAWQADGVLVRFSLRIGHEQAAAVVGLLSRDRLVYHHVVTSPAWHELRAGHVLIRLIGLWASEHRTCVLDFGIGGEEYKRRYANHEESLVRICAGRSRASSCYVRGRTEARIRRSPALSNAWDRYVNRVIRGHAVRAARALRTGARVLVTTDARRSMAALFRLLLRTRVITDRQIVYRATGRQTLANPNVIEPRTSDVLQMLHRELGLSEAHRAAVVEYRHRAARPFAYVEGGALTSVGWLRAASAGNMPEWIAAEGRLWHIEHCVTTRDASGLNGCRQVFEAILASVPVADPVLVSVPRWDRALRQALTSAGFQPVALRVQRGRNGVFQRSSAFPGAIG